ncbi:MAG: sigma-70 family RNA polymerase sigma factor [bacterium]|nr:sigma-70 family RNA polymerase sigma factor [bacterium]
MVDPEPTDMADDRDWTRLIDGLRGGDDAVMSEFYDDFGPALERLADRHIADGLRRRFGAESVVQSACRTFLRRARAQEFTLSDARELWSLLCAITLNKVHDQARFHLRRRRRADREVEVDAGGSSTVESPSDDPGPDEAAVFAEELERFLVGLAEEDRRIIDLKLQERSNAEIADELGCCERTIRRLLGKLRERLERELAA